MKMSEFARIKAIFLISVFLFLLPALAVFGGGGRETELTRADELINNKLYDDAIILLSDFTRRNPDYFDETQKRLHRIYQIREEFNRAADELIITLLDDPDNNEKIYTLTRYLYTLEHENSPIMINFVARAQEIALFNINRNKLRGIMERGGNLLERGESYSALQAYAEGMTIMRDDFYAGNFTESNKSEVRREAQRIDSILTSFRQTSAQLSSSSAEYIRAIERGDMSVIRETSGQLSSAADRFHALKQELYTSNNIFSRILNEIRSANPDIGDRNHLAFVSVIINGRSGESIQEGMLGAFDIFWNISIDPVYRAIASYMERVKNMYIAAINEGNYFIDTSSLNTMAYHVNFSKILFEKKRQLIESSDSQIFIVQGNSVLISDIRPYIEISALNEAGNSLNQAVNAGLRRNIDLSSLDRRNEGNITASDAFGIEQQTIIILNDLQNEIDAIIANANAVSAELNDYYRVTHITDAVKAIENIHTQFLAQEQQSINRYFTIAHQNLQSTLNTRRGELETGRRYIYGPRGEEESYTALRYPSQALPVLTAMLAAASADLDNANALTGLSAAPEIAASSAGYQVTIRELTAIVAQGRELLEAARSRSAQAEAYRQEGERLFLEAQNAFQRRDFSIARDRIERASVRFGDSLFLQDSASVREMRDVQLINLGQSIASAENEMVIAEVRSLLNSARNSYFNGNFVQAEDSLVRARNRWHTTNPEENEEVSLWLSIVRNALSANTGRVISPTAPLYPEMSQLLSQAQRNYEEGVRYINTNERTSGLAKFDEARQLTREVKIVFPLNQEAGILDLRIEQFIDPAEFNATFEQRIRNAVAGTKTRSIEAFADLQNLAEINPSYPNIRALINQAEIDMGYRPPPVNPAEIARSNELTASANRIVQANQTAQYEVARLQLDQAITLNPDNTEAMRVRDILLGRMSIPGTIILTMDDEASYQQALRELNAGNVLVAYARVEALLQNPRNRNITKLLELQRRIQSVL